MYNMSYTEDFVRNLYSKISILEPQQLDFRLIAARLGIKVFYWKEQSQALFFKDYPYILINNQLNEQQQWQDFGHELGHVLLHVGNQHKMSPSFREYQEYKANHFMYHACIPTFMLNKIKKEHLSVEFVMKLFKVEQEFARARLIQYISKVDMTKWNFQT